VEQFSAVNMQAAARVRQIFDVPIDVPLVGSVGRLHPQKDFATLLAAIAQVRKRIPTVRLLLVGDGELRDELESQSRSLGLSEIVTFAGSRTDVPEILAAVDVFTLSSLWEGMSNAALEAMAAGLPVVATAVGGTPEVVVDEVTGLLVPPHDPTSLAGALTTLLREPALRRRMGQAGRERVQEQFSVERMVCRTEALYTEMLRENSVPVLYRSSQVRY
jgi:glycosyltransferase involved in cell wall biosynthesis